MAISMGSGDGAEPEAMSDINTTPLVDVMLVLLIIFLITVPVAIETVELTLPDIAFEPTTTRPENVQLWIKASDTGACEVYWGNSPVNSVDLLRLGQERLEEEAEKVGGYENFTEETLPQVHIRGDIATPYRCIGGPIYTLQFAGFQKIGFISEPGPMAAVSR